MGTVGSVRQAGAVQAQLKSWLIDHDSGCLVTDAPWTECTASHIVPQSRDDASRPVFSGSSFLVSLTHQRYFPLLNLFYLLVAFLPPSPLSALPGSHRKAH